MLIILLTAFGRPPSVEPLPSDRTLSVLPEGSSQEQLRAAAAAMGDWTIELAGVPVDGAALERLAEPGGEPILRHVREQLGRPVDLPDFILFLDDVLAAEARRGERFHVHSGRARAAGILLHPDDIFGEAPRRYPRRPTLAVDRPEPQQTIDRPAEDGDLLGPAWTVRFRNPSDRASMLQALRESAPESDFADRIEALLTQLEAEGAEVYLASTVRSRERGYLMWGAFSLSRARDQADLERRLARVEDRNRAWGLNIDIRWRHPDGWEATRDAARRMADSYDVVYATERGARSSNHYGADAADLIALDLPRRLTLTAPDGATRSFDLSDPDEPRDLSLTPRLIAWIEAHWGLKKLRSDYPHWSDARR